jgi:hypothetical protein
MARRTPVQACSAARSGTSLDDAASRRCSRGRRVKLRSKRVRTGAPQALRSPHIDDSAANRQPPPRGRTRPHCSKAKRARRETLPIALKFDDPLLAASCVHLPSVAAAHARARNRRLPRIAADLCEHRGAADAWRCSARQSFVKSISTPLHSGREKSRYGTSEQRRR